MKLRNIACLIVAVIMMTALAISASAIENVTVSATLPKAETKLATAADLGAAYSWGLQVKNSHGWMASPADGYTADILNGGESKVVNLADPAWNTDDNGNAVAYYIPYVSYKVSATEGNVLESLSVSLYAAAQAKANKHQYALAFYVTSSLDVAEDGKVDFSKLTPVAVRGQYGDPKGDAINKTDLNYVNNADAPRLELDLTSAVTALGDVEEIYVTVAFNMTWNGASKQEDGSYAGGDVSRLRLWELNMTAGQKEAPVVEEPEQPEQPEEPEQNPSTGDAAVISALSLALISGAAIVATRKKAR